MSEVLGMHECKCEVCNPGHLTKVEEVTRLKTKSGYRDSVKREEWERLREEVSRKLQAEMAQGLKEFEAKCQKDSEDQIRSDAFAKSQERWKAETEARIRTELEEKSLPLLPMCRCRLQTTLALPLLPIYRFHLQTILTPLRRMLTTRPATISTNPLSPLPRTVRAKLPRATAPLPHLAVYGSSCGESITIWRRRNYASESLRRRRYR